MRPEWISCIGHDHLDLKGQSWCGGTEKPFFISLDHAAENGRQGGRLVACRECVAAIVKALSNGHDDPEYKPDQTSGEP